MIKLREIAERANVNVSTVSKALNNSSELNTETVRKIRQTAKELGYVSRKKHAGRNHTVGVILPEINSLYYSTVAHSLKEEFEKKGFLTLCAFAGLKDLSSISLVETFMRKNVDGIIIDCDACNAGTDWIEKSLGGGRFPTVVFTRDDSHCTMDTVKINWMQLVRVAVDYLIEMGHKKIAYIGEKNSAISEELFRRIMKEYGMTENYAYIKSGEERMELGGYLRCKELLREKSMPTAIVSSYDQITIGIMKAIAEAGLRVPEDISIIDLANLSLSEYMHPSITTVITPLEQMCRIAAKVLIDYIKDPADHIPQNVTLQTKLVERDSVRRI